MKKIFNALSLTLSVTLLTGCISSGQPKIKNESVGKHHLYVNFNETDKSSYKVTPVKVKGFDLNTYEPVIYNTETLKPWYDKSKPVLWFRSSFRTNHGVYQEVECDADKAPIDTLETIGGVIITLGLIIPATGGIFCHEIKYFDYQHFDKDVKSIINEKDRERLLISFDSLKSVQNKSENLVNKKEKSKNNLNKIREAYNNQINELYMKYSSKYIANQPKIKLKLVDKSGLYKKEDLSTNIRVVENSLPKLKQIKPEKIQYIDYSSLVNKIFPCTGIDICISTMDEAKQDILKQSKNDLVSKKSLAEKALLKEETIYKKNLSKNKKDLKKATSFYMVENTPSSFSKSFNKGDIQKTIHYNVRVQDKIASNKKVLNAKIVVQNIDYTNIFQNYLNQNKDIKINFNKKTKSYTLENLTNNFLQVKSISLYYNGSIYNLTVNKSNDQFSVELAPKAVKKIGLYRDFKESTYKKLTKNKAKSLKNRFGFAIRYTKGNQNNNITLYKENKKSVYELIKNI